MKSSSNSLDDAVLEQIADKFLNQLRARLSEKDILLEVTPAARGRILEYGVDPLYGARPMKRHIQREIETAVARAILENPDVQGKTLIVDADEDTYIVKVKEKLN